MTKWVVAIVVALIPVLFAVKLSVQPYTVEVGLNNGSTIGRHIVSRMIVTTISGGGGNFAMGSISSYPGGYSTGGRMSAPSYIEGYWAKGNPEPNSPLISYHRISAKIPENAEAKMKAMDSYYLRFYKRRGAMQVIVDGPRVRVFYTKNCFDNLHDCTPRQGADPNGWVVKAPDDSTEVVVLFDGIGESSATPFPDTHFADLAS